ncbi:hypothetical protein [Moorena sp. SIO3A2]|uniref:hypothetical protein n=1 Tax=Moorena sp. SIO3A2 TaxID=2607841 RepID=UPI0013B7BAE1|nr:hypothetical protein [Moorena sp. SIO3A2]NER90387.1 hypothetical protein [Moorena sp. SIO3A2]
MMLQLTGPSSLKRASLERSPDFKGWLNSTRPEIFITEKNLELSDTYEDTPKGIVQWCQFVYFGEEDPQTIAFSYEVPKFYPLNPNNGRIPLVEGEHLPGQSQYLADLFGMRNVARLEKKLYFDGWLDGRPTCTVSEHLSEDNDRSITKKWAWRSKVTSQVQYLQVLYRRKVFACNL